MPPSSDDASPIDADPASALEDDGGLPPSPRAVGLGTVVGAVAGLWGLLIGLERLYDNSFLTHLATGRLILADGRVPTSDPYSFTAAGDPWTVQSWLASAIYAGAEDLGGLGGIRLVNGLLCAALGIAVWLLTARSRSFGVRLVVTAAVLVPATALWSGRPLLFGLLGLAAVGLVADERLDARWLVPVGWIWVNTHGSFPYAILLLGLLAVGRRLDEGTWGSELRALRWAGLGIALGAVNPLGPRLLLFPLTLVSKTEAFRSIAEWQPPAYEALVDYWTVGLLFVGVLALVRTPRWRSALPLVAFGALAVTSARNLAPLLLVVAPVLAGSVPDAGIAVGAVRRASLRLGLVAVVAMAVLFSVTALGRPDVALDAYPVEPVAWMESEGLWNASSRVVAPDFVGNYREAQRGDEANVFMDDRVDMYPLDVLEDYRVLLEAGPGWDAVLTRRDISAVLWQEDSPLGAALEGSEAWAVVHRDGDWIVVRPSPSR